MTKQRCFCGCYNFTLEMNEDGKNRITFICAGCKCQRTIRTPGVGCTYEFEPPTVPEPKEQAK